MLILPACRMPTWWGGRPGDIVRLLSDKKLSPRTFVLELCGIMMQLMLSLVR